MPDHMGFRAIALIVGFVIVIVLVGVLVISALSMPAVPTPTPTVSVAMTPTQGPSPAPNNPLPTATGEPPSPAPTQLPPTATSTLQATLGITPTATANMVVVVNLGGNTTLGQFLVDTNGMTLYTFSQDTPTSSACAGECAATWPPVVIAAGTQPGAGQGLSGQLATITRSEGSLQVTYNGHPLYRYAQDTVPGDAKGHGIDNQWFVATP